MPEQPPTSEEVRKNGFAIGEAMAKEAILECVDDGPGRMKSTVKFKDGERPDMSLEAYMTILEKLGGTAANYYDAPGSFDQSEQGLYDGLQANGALNDLTIGPYW